MTLPCDSYKGFSPKCATMATASRRPCVAFIPLDEALEQILNDEDSAERDGKW